MAVKLIGSDAQARAAVNWSLGAGARGALLRYNINMDDVADYVSISVSKIQEVAHDPQKLHARLTGIASAS